MIRDLLLLSPLLASSYVLPARPQAASTRACVSMQFRRPTVRPLASPQLSIHSLNPPLTMQGSNSGLFPSSPEPKPTKSASRRSNHLVCTTTTTHAFRRTAAEVVKKAAPKKVVKKK